MDELETLPSLLSSAPDIHASIQCLILDGAGLDADYVVSLRAVMKLISGLPKLRELDISDLPFFVDPGVVYTPHRHSLRRLSLAESRCQRDHFLSLMNIIALFSNIDELHLSVVDDDQVREPLPPPEQLVQEGLIPSGGPVEIHTLKAPELEPHWLPILYATLRTTGALSSTAPMIDVTLSYDVQEHEHPSFRDDEDVLRVLINAYGTFLRQLGPSIRRLDFDFLYPIALGHAYFTGQWDILGLSACKNLENLKLRLDTATIYFDPDATEIVSDAYSAYLEILSIAQFPKLEGMTLCIAVCDRMENDPIFDLDWERLEATLCRRPMLKTFLLDVFFGVSRYSLQPFTSRLGGLGPKLLFKCFAPAPGFGRFDDEDGVNSDYDDDDEGLTSVTDEAGASTSGKTDDGDEDELSEMHAL